MHGEYKVTGGKLVAADLSVLDSCLRGVRISGDFFLEPDEALDRIHDALEGAGADIEAPELARRIEANLEPGDHLYGIDAMAIALAVRRAVRGAIGWEDLEFEVIHGGPLAPEMHVALDEVLPGEVAAGRRGPLFRIWEWDSPLVVMGSFQSFENEIDPAGTQRHGIAVVRRITGGGAMFMEPGNCITYSLVVPTALVEGLSFEQSYRFLDDWVLGALEEIGVKARYVPLNDIASDAGKIGGAAQKRFSTGVTLHHVTMAYDIDAAKMLDVIRIGKEKMRDKGHRSAIKRVDPMRSQTGMERSEIVAGFLDYFRSRYACRDSSYTSEELKAAAHLVRTKFTTPEWTHRIE